MDYIEKFIQAIKLQPRFLFGISILGLILLFNPFNVIPFLSLESFVVEYRKWIGFTTLLAIVFFFVQLVPLLKKFYYKKQYSKRIVEELEALSKEEKVLLLYCIDNNQKTISLPLSHPIANSLKSKGILQMAIGTGNITSWAFNINHDVWKKLNKDRELLTDGLSEQEIRHIVNRIFDRFYN